MSLSLCIWILLTLKWHHVNGKRLPRVQTKVYTNFTLTDVYSTRLDDTRLPDETQADRPPCKQTPTDCTQVRKEKTKKQRQKTHEENQLSLSLRAKVRFRGEWDIQPVAGLQRHPLQKSNRRYKSLVNGTGPLPSLFINHKLQLWRKKKKEQQTAKQTAWHLSCVDSTLIGSHKPLEIFQSAW